MQRQDLPDLEPGRLLEQRLRLGAVLADDADVVAASLAVPALRVLDVVRAELAEAVRREEHLVRRVIGDDHLWPMHHRGRDEGEDVPPGRQRVALLHDQPAVREIVAEIALHHREGLCARDDRRLRIRRGELRHVGGVVRLHVLDDQVVDGRVADLRPDVPQPLVAEARVDGVKDDGLPVLDEIGVVGHSVRHDVLAFEQVDVMVVDADVLDIV